MTDEFEITVSALEVRTRIPCSRDMTVRELTRRAAQALALDSRNYAAYVKRDGAFSELRPHDTLAVAFGDTPPNEVHLVPRIALGA